LFERFLDPNRAEAPHFPRLAAWSNPLRDAGGPECAPLRGAGDGQSAVGSGPNAQVGYREGGHDYQGRVGAGAQSALRYVELIRRASTRNAHWVHLAQKLGANRQVVTHAAPPWRPPW